MTRFVLKWNRAETEICLIDTKGKYNPINFSDKDCTDDCIAKAVWKLLYDLEMEMKEVD